MWGRTTTPGEALADDDRALIVEASISDRLRLALAMLGVAELRRTRRPPD